MTQILAQHFETNSRDAGRQPRTHQAVSASLVHEWSTGRQELESSIAQKFQSEYDARISHFLPHLLSLSVAGQSGATVGIRPAHEGALFLEQYVDSPIEQAAAGVLQAPIDRDQIVEIGNLTATMPRVTYALFAVLANVLRQSGYRWVVCTATPQVEKMLTKMNFSSRRICSATSEHMGDGADDWGDYYASRPTVIVGDIRFAAAQVSENRSLSALTSQLSTPIRRMAESLQKPAR